MFGFIKDQLSKIYNNFSKKIWGLFSQDTIDKQTLLELESLLISADTGVKTTRKIIQELTKRFENNEIKEGADLKKALEDILFDELTANKPDIDANIFILVGINGSGKTTFAGKFADMFAKQGKKVLLVAGDTFRAAAANQLLEWAKKSNVAIEIGKENSEPASVVFNACARFSKEKFDILIIDTAGRLQNKINLMKELEKIHKVVIKQLPEQKIKTLLTIDAMLGQNSFDQAKIFNESTNVDGIVLTKMDGTGKGGVVFGITGELGIPIVFLCFGEEIDKLKQFDAREYVSQLLSIT